MIDLVLTVVVAVLGCALFLTVVVIWSIKRHRAPRLHIESDAPLAELLPSLSGLTHGAALKGNAVEILENGAFFEVMF
jgi:cardiolipin synthase A/B